MRTSPHRKENRLPGIILNLLITVFYRDLSENRAMGRDDFSCSHIVQ